MFFIFLSNRGQEPVRQQSLSFWAPGVGFVEDSFSTDQGDASDGELPQVRGHLARWPATHLLLRDCVLGWGPLF